MIKIAALTLLLLPAMPAGAKPRKPMPGADELILKTLAGPATSYAAVERTQVLQPGTAKRARAKAIKAKLLVAPGGRVRREILAAKKNAPSVVLVRAGSGETPEKGLARLKSIYDLAVSTGGVVVGRKTWRIDLRLKSGELRRTWWVDRDSGVLMKRETYRPDGSVRKRERLVTLEFPAASAPSDFKPDPPPGPWAPDGFVLIGQAGQVRRYSNGLESFVILLENGKRVVQGDLAEDDSARVLETAGK